VEGKARSCATELGKSRVRWQAQIVRQFLLRDIEKVRAEWAMLCTTHNLRKQAAARAA
jgi:hypothetical protein